MHIVIGNEYKDKGKKEEGKARDRWTVSWKCAGKCRRETRDRLRWPRTLWKTLQGHYDYQHSSATGKRPSCMLFFHLYILIVTSVLQLHRHEKMTIETRGDPRLAWFVMWISSHKIETSQSHTASLKRPASLEMESEAYNRLTLCPADSNVINVNICSNG